MTAPTPSTPLEPPEEGVSSGVKSSGKKRPRGGIVVEFPGSGEGEWDRWHILPGGQSVRLPGEAAPPPQSRRVVCIPSARVFSWPLWIAPEGDATNLVRLELSGRHLLKRGMEASLRVIPVLERNGRRLVLAVAPEEPFPEEGMPASWKNATRFSLTDLEASSKGHDLVIRREWGGIHAAFHREGKLVWFCPVRRAGLEGLLHRSALRLHAEGILAHLPESIRIEGLSPVEERECSSRFAILFPGARVSSSSGREIPTGEASENLDLPPSVAVDARNSFANRRRFAAIAASAALIYILLILWGAVAILVGKATLRDVRREISALEQPSLLAKTDIDRWKSLRPAVDPSTYALDLLAAAAVPTEGGKTRLTRFSMEPGKLQISGEASDVTEAYGFIEAVKKNPLLQQYEWNAGQPQLAGKNSVRFEMEGSQVMERTAP